VGIWGIKVSGIYPGSVETEFGEHAGADRKSGVRMPKILVLSAEDVAREVVRLTRHSRRMVVVPRVMRPAVWLAWHFPGIVDWGVERFFVRRERFVG
jgi:short-subunit dehydrogenase